VQAISERSHPASIEQNERTLELLGEVRDLARVGRLGEEEDDARVLELLGARLEHVGVHRHGASRVLGGWRLKLGRERREAAQHARVEEGEGGDGQRAPEPGLRTRAADVGNDASSSPRCATLETATSCREASARGREEGELGTRGPCA